jgi:outer membrane protein assembly factor BamD (BamD/ComL family)
MGTKQDRRRKHLYLFFACFLMIPFLLSGCAHLYEKVITKPDFNRADDLAGQGNYQGAADKYEQIIAGYSGVADAAYFQLGIIYALPKNQNKDYHKAMECFQKLVNNYPESRYKQRSEVLISLLSEIANRDKRASVLYKQIEKLEQQLEQMKEVDMNLKEKKKTFH